MHLPARQAGRAVLDILSINRFSTECFGLDRHQLSQPPHSIRLNSCQPGKMLKLILEHLEHLEHLDVTKDLAHTKIIQLEHLEHLAQANGLDLPLRKAGLPGQPVLPEGPAVPHQQAAQLRWFFVCSKEGRSSVITRREAVLGLAGFLAQAAQMLPANKNVNGTFGPTCGNRTPAPALPDILDVMHDTGAPLVLSDRVSADSYQVRRYPGTDGKGTVPEGPSSGSSRSRSTALRTMQQSMPRFSNTQNRDDVSQVFWRRTAGDFFSVARAGNKSADAFAIMCRFYNQLGETAGEMGFKAGLHNHLGQMVQTPEEIDRSIALPIPSCFISPPDTAHVYLGGAVSGHLME